LAQQQPNVRTINVIYVSGKPVTITAFATHATARTIAGSRSSEPYGCNRTMRLRCGEPVTFSTILASAVMK
jgi:hypothetical protein